MWFKCHKKEFTQIQLMKDKIHIHVEEWGRRRERLNDAFEKIHVILMFLMGTYIM